MPQTITYNSLRSEVWTHYWRLWKQRLWRVHASLFLTIAACALIVLADGHQPTTTTVVIAFGCGLLPCVVLALYPLAWFKPQVRTLKIDHAGLETWIGKLHAAVAWRDVAAISDRDDQIVIARTNGNAFLVPRRAFATPADRAAFLTMARQAWAAARP